MFEFVLVMGGVSLDKTLEELEDVSGPDPSCRHQNYVAPYDNLWSPPGNPNATAQAFLKQFKLIQVTKPLFCVAIPPTLESPWD